jgi:polar amino acid transport system substrate-binding protein
MDITKDRMQVLLFAQPYYATPSVLFVNPASTYQQPSDLNGKKIGACLDCTQYAYLDGTLDLPGQKMTSVVKDPQIVGYDVEPPGLDDLAAGNGKVDAFLASISVGQPYLDGKKLRYLNQPLFFAYSAPAVDRRSGKDPTAFLAKITEIIKGLQADGTLKQLSEQFFGADLATQAASFDLSSIGQTVR